MKEDNRNDKILNNFQTIGPFVLEIGMYTNWDTGSLKYRILFV